MKKYYKELILGTFLIIMLINGFFVKFIRYGDGFEYLTMINSIINHLSFNATDNDFNMAKNIFNETGIKITGYFTAINGLQYCYHFWAYSLFGTVPYLILKFLNIKVVSVFYVYNVSLLFFLLWYILYKTSFTNKLKICISVLSVINPVLLYTSWSHPEVYIYVNFLIGLLAVIENKYIAAVFFTAMASLQGSVIAIVPFFIFIYAIIKYRHNLSYRKVIIMGLMCMITFLPYMFYGYYFHELSLIAKAGAASIKNVSIDKVYSIFFDLNFGYILYEPVLLFICLYQCLKLNKMTIVFSVLSIVLAFAASCQSNWNSGMSYINRYCIWMLPCLIISIINYVEKLKYKGLNKFMAIYLVITGPILLLIYSTYNAETYLRFSPLAKIVMLSTPEWYNPVPEIFVERSIGKEENFSGRIEILDENNEIRKAIITNGSENKSIYLNGRTRYSWSYFWQHSIKIKIISTDITKNMRNVTYDDGFDLYENGFGRWIIKNESNIYFNDIKNKKIVILVKKREKPVDTEIYLNGKLSWNGIITEDRKIILNNTTKDGINVVKFVINSTPYIPQTDGKTEDNRKLYLAIGSIEIE